MPKKKNAQVAASSPSEDSDDEGREMSRGNSLESSMEDYEKPHAAGAQERYRGNNRRDYYGAIGGPDYYEAGEGYYDQHDLHEAHNPLESKNLIAYFMVGVAFCVLLAFCMFEYCAVGYHRPKYGYVNLQNPDTTRSPLGWRFGFFDESVRMVRSVFRGMPWR